MSADDKKKHEPIPVALDDDDDDTVVDGGGPSLAELAALGASDDDTDTELDHPVLGRGTPPPRPLPSPRAGFPVEARNFRGGSLPRLPPIADDDESDDDDATHVLPRDGRVTSSSAKPLSRARPPVKELSDDGMLPSDEATARLPAPRRIDAVPRISADEGDDRTLSRPVMKKATFVPSGEGSPARLLDELGLSERQDARATSADGEVVVFARRAPEATAHVDDDVEPVLQNDDGADIDDGDDDMGAFLIIDAPVGATVFVDGEERGQGRVIVNGVDSRGRYAIRVHKAGYLPWSGTTSLDGMREAIVRPTLKKREN